LRLPRDISGQALADALKELGYEPTRQVGSHLRLTTQTNGEHHLTVPLHDNLRVGTLSAILSDIQTHFQLTRDELLAKLDL
jgi:predicted RNA binding protein YcfA (HicA-like mRNA interferase family)